MEDQRVRVWSETRRVFGVLKQDVTFEQYKVKWPDAVRITDTQYKKKPSVKVMTKWMMDGVAKATDGCRVEPDGVCSHGHPSWLLLLNVI